jgi:hypothetical protein
LLTAPLVQLDQHFLAGIEAGLKALVRFRVFLARLLLAGRFGEQPLGFVVQPPQHFHQVVRRHRQLKVDSVLVGPPANVGQQAEVFAELKAQPLGRGEVLVLF